MREASLQDKAIKFPHLLFIYPLASGNWSAQNLMKMGNQEEKMIYEAPIIEIIEVEVEKGFAISGETRGNINDLEYENW